MFPCKPTARASEQGFSLLELFIAMSLIGLFLGAVQESVVVGLRATNAADEREDIRLQLANALDRLTREASLASNVTQANDQAFKFDADLDGDGTTETSITYAVVNGDLVRTHGGTAVTLIRDLATLDFDYQDLNGATMATPVTPQTERDMIRLAQVVLTGTKDTETLSVAEAVYLRNR